MTPQTVDHQAPLSMGFPRKNTGVGFQFLLHRVFLTQGSNPCLLHWQAILYHRIILYQKLDFIEWVFFFLFLIRVKKKMTHALQVFLKVLIVFIRIVLLMEKETATHSSTLAWRIPWAEKPDLQSTGSRRVGNDWTTSLSLFAFMHWGKKWQPTPVFLPGESQGQRSLGGCRLWGRIASDTTEAT